jgi:hypothetical protein
MSLVATGLAAFGGLADAYTKNIQIGMKESAQAYSNTMRQISTAQSLNASTLHEVNLQDSSKRLEATLQLESLKNVAASEVSAAAAGVAGGSVEQALLGLKRSALGAQHARMRNLDSSLFAASKQKSNIRLAGIMGKDISVIQRPSTASALLGMGASLLDKYDANLPKGLQARDGARLF